MNKKLLIPVCVVVIIIIAIIIGIVAKKDDRLVFTLEDANYGTVSMKYNEKDGFVIDEKVEDGISAEYEIENEKINADVDMYFIEHWGTMDEYIKSTDRDKKETYKAFEVNGHKGYLYAQGNNPETSLDIHILMEENAETNRFIELYMYCSPNHMNEEHNLITIFESETVQEILNTIEYTPVVK